MKRFLVVTSAAAVLALCAGCKSCPVDDTATQLDAGAAYETGTGSPGTSSGSASGTDDSGNSDDSNSGSSGSGSGGSSSAASGSNFEDVLLESDADIEAADTLPESLKEIARGMNLGTKDDLTSVSFNNLVGEEWVNVGTTSQGGTIRYSSWYNDGTGWEPFLRIAPGGEYDENTPDSELPECPAVPPPGIGAGICMYNGERLVYDSQ